jgi:elongation factor P
MISVTQLRNGTTYLADGDPYKVIKYTHTHISRGSGTIKVKVRNLRTGAVLDKTYKGGEKVDDVEVNKKRMQFLYKEDGGFVFMDASDYSQVTISESVLGDDGIYLADGKEYMIGFWFNSKKNEEEVLEVEIPLKMNFKVIEADPSARGDTQGAASKDAVLENKLRVRVPLFIKEGDMVRVDTRSGEYVERVS